MLPNSKLNSIGNLSEALIDMEMSHEELLTILKQQSKYEKMKETVSNERKKLEGIVNSRNNYFATNV